MENLEIEYKKLLEEKKELEEKLKLMEINEKLKELNKVVMPSLYGPLSRGKNIVYSIGRFGRYSAEEEINVIYKLIKDYGFTFVEKLLIEKAKKLYPKTEGDDF